MQTNTVRNRRPRTIVDHGDYIEHSGSSIFTFTLLLITLLIYDVTVIPQKTDNSAKAIINDLINNVHNQTEAIQTVAKALHKMYNHEQNVNIVNFIGATGVGKTFMATIVKRHFPSSVFELYGPLNNIAQQHITISNIRSSNSDFNLIVVEDLTLTDTDKLLDFLHQIPQDLIALVVCIFNIQETDNNLNHKINYSNIDKIKDKFSKVEIPHEIAKFHEFSKDQASEWVMKQLVIKGIESQLHSEIAETVLFEQNIKYHGLKGLSSKINLEL